MNSYTSIQIKSSSTSRSKNIEEIAVLITDVWDFFNNIDKNPENRIEHNQKMIDFIIDSIEQGNNNSFAGKFAFVLDVQDILDHSIFNLLKQRNLDKGIVSRIKIDLEDSALTAGNIEDVKSKMRELNDEFGIEFSISKPTTKQTVEHLYNDKYATTIKIDVYKPLTDLQGGDVSFEQIVEQISKQISPLLENKLKTITFVGVDDKEQKMYLDEILNSIYQSKNINKKDNPKVQIQGFVDLLKTDGSKLNNYLESLDSITKTQTSKKEFNYVR